MINKKGRPSRSMPKGFEEKLKKGWTYEKLAAYYKCGKQCVSRWKKEMLQNECQ